jgi:hypothetical protein
MPSTVLALATFPTTALLADAEKPMLLQQRPDVRRQIPALEDLPVIGSITQLLTRPINKGLFFLGQPGIPFLGQDAFEIRLTGKQFALHPRGACIDGFLLGPGDGG